MRRHVKSETYRVPSAWHTARQCNQQQKNVGTKPRSGVDEMWIKIQLESSGDGLVVIIFYSFAHLSY